MAIFLWRAWTALNFGLCLCAIPSSSTDTSVIQMLSRRIPLIQAPQAPNAALPPPLPPKQAPSSLPLHLQRSNTVGSATPPRVGSPQLVQRPLSPPVNAPAPYRPNSPFRARTSLLSITASPQISNLPPSPNPAVRRPDESIDVDLVVDYLPRDELVVEKPFKIAFTVTVSAPVLPTPAGQPRKERVVTLAIQHVLPAREASSLTAPVSAPPIPPEPWSPKLPSSGFSTPSPYGTPARGDFSDTLAQRLIAMSPRDAQADATSDARADVDGQETGQATPAPPLLPDEHPTIILPPPYAVSEPSNVAKKRDVTFLGTSAIILPPIRVPLPVNELSVRGHGHERNISESTTDSETDDEMSETIGKTAPRMLLSQDFQLEFLPLRAGFSTVGGLRVLLVEDRLVDADGEEPKLRRPADVRTLREWDVVAELWVKTTAGETA